MYILLGKHGDQISVLPFLYQEYLETGIKPVLMVSLEYNQIATEAGFIEPIIFNGSWFDIKGALAQAKRDYRNVIILQSFGRDWPVKHIHPSFQHDQWDKAGRLDQFGKLEMPWLKRESVEKNKTILFGDLGESAPFPHVEHLQQVLVKQFPSHRVVRLSSIRLPRVLDLLMLYDAADLLVTVDTLHLHLSAASKVPVIALIEDQRGRWQGSAWQPRFKMHCRYGDYEGRKPELLKVASNAIYSNPEPVSVNGWKSNRYGYNLSLIQFGEKLLTTHRYHPYEDWRTTIAISDGQTVSDIKFPPHSDDHTHEDCRLFEHQGKLMASYVVAQRYRKQYVCVVRYGMLIQKDGKWLIEKEYQPEFGNNNWTGTVKNLCPFESSGKIHFIWGNDKHQTVIQVDGNRVKEEYESAAVKWDYGQIRGGSIVPCGDSYLRFFHSRAGGSLNHKPGSFRYYVGWSRMSLKPPFETTYVNPVPLLSGDERYVPDCFHWKPNVKIVYGAIRREGRILLGLGINDSSCEIQSFDEKEFET